MGEEAMERDVGLATTDKFIVNEGRELNSSGDAVTTGSLFSIKSEKTVRSRYLSPHMASCHDFCKYGKKHDSEAELMRQNFRKLLKKKVPPHERNQVTILVPGERKAGSVTKTKASPKVKTEYDYNEVQKPSTLTPGKNSFASGERNTPQTSTQKEQSRGKRPNSGEKKTNTKKGGSSGEKKTNTKKGGSPLPPKTSHNQVNIIKSKDRLPSSENDAFGQQQSDIEGVKMSKGRGSAFQSKHPNISSPEKHGVTKSEENVSPPSDDGSSDQSIIVEKETKSCVKKLSRGRGSAFQSKNPNISSPEKRGVIKSEDLSPPSVDGSSEQSYVDENETKSSVKKPVSPGLPKVIEQKAPSLVSEPKRIKQKVRAPPKGASVVGKPAISLKTRAPLIRTLSQHKSSRGLIVRKNEQNMTTGSLGASEEGGREPLKPSTASHSASKSSQILITGSKQGNKIVKGLVKPADGERKALKLTSRSLPPKTPHNNVPSLQPRRLRSTKQISSTRDGGSSLQLRKLKSVKRVSSTHDGGSSLQLRTLKSTKRVSSTHDGGLKLQLVKLRRVNSNWNSTPQGTTVPSFQLIKLRSVKRTTTTQDSVSSVEPRKLWNLKPVSNRSSLPSLSLRKLKSLRRTFSGKDKDKAEDVKANGKPESEHNGIDQNPKADESELTTATGNKVIEGDQKEMEADVKHEDSADNEKKGHSKTTSAQPEDTTPAPFKLKFRKGKVLNFRSDSMAARRLWFNIGMLGTENPVNGLLGRKIRKKREIADSEEPKSPDLETVVLKHQGVAEKKDDKALFNHVIEETASKLVEARKSKVKALVGAFETVISLQDSKPALAV